MDTIPTVTKPTHPGWWWIKVTTDDDWEPKQVVNGRDSLFVFDRGYELCPVDQYQGEWGPEIPQYKP